MHKASQQQRVLRTLTASILVGWIGVPVAFAANDPGCPAAPRQGSYAPCIAELPKGALVPQGATTPTPPVGLYHYLNSPQAGGVHTSAIPKAQSIAMLPNPQTIWSQWKKVPLLAVTYSAKLDGGIGQTNPTSPPLTAQFACPSVAEAGGSGIPGYSAGAPAQWSGWDLKWTSYDTSAANTPNKGWNGWDYTCKFTPQPTRACSVSYISGYDSQGNPIYSTYNYTAYGQWSWNDGNNGTWSTPSCNDPGPGNASPPPPKPTCGAGQTQTSAPTWNGSAWVGLGCSSPQNTTTCSWPGGTVPWGSGCSAYVGPTTANPGQTLNLTNTASGYTGSVTKTCQSDGNWATSNVICNPAYVPVTKPSGCPAQTIPAWTATEFQPFPDGGGQWFWQDPLPNATGMLVRVPVSQRIIMPGFVLPAGGSGDVALVTAMECTEFDSCNNNIWSPIFKSHEETIDSVKYIRYDVWGGLGTFSAQGSFAEQFVCDPQTSTWKLKSYILSDLYYGGA
jgi:hypothetical protein